MRSVSVRSLRLHVIIGAGLACAIVAVVSGQGAPPPSQSVRAGVYTKEQAARGEKLYTQMCAECHGDDLTGREQANALAGPEFGAAWEGEPISGLFVKSRQMPPGGTNTLTRPELVDIVSYILSFNGLKSGTTPLSDEQSVLNTITFEMPPLTK